VLGTGLRHEGETERRVGTGLTSSGTGLKTDPSPVISIGNIAMGGRGKTPVAGLVARLLVAAGERPAILSRGHKRRRRDDGVVVVSDAAHLVADVDRAGDEPMMLARHTPGAIVLVCEMRALARALATRALGATVVVLDDGFQHRSLARDIDIVCIQARDLSDRRVPFGRLREPPAALARADAIIVDGPAPPAGGAGRAGQPVFTLTRTPGAPVPLEPHRRAIQPGDPIVSVCGIAEPERFHRGLVEQGWNVVDHLSLPDHYAFRVRDLDVLSALVARHRAAAILTTEKDAMRLLPLRPLPVPIAYIPLDVAVDPADDFRAWLLGRLAEARA